MERKFNKDFFSRYLFTFFKAKAEISGERMDLFFSSCCQGKFYLNVSRRDETLVTEQLEKCILVPQECFPFKAKRVSIEHEQIRKKEPDNSLTKESLKVRQKDSSCFVRSVMFSESILLILDAPLLFGTYRG